MRKLLSGLFALALLTGVAAGCTDSNQSRPVGESPSERRPAASPPTSPSDRGTVGGAPSSPSTPGGSDPTRTMPSTPPSR
jgi:hypothetical protein